MVEGAEPCIGEDDVVLVTAAGLELGEHVLIGVRGDAAHRDAGRRLEALLDLRIDVVLPRHHHHGAVVGPGPAGGEQPADRESGTG